MNASLLLSAFADTSIPHQSAYRVSTTEGALREAGWRLRRSGQLQNVQA
jgi:hypothetical protein